jgi:RNA polymerase sigma-70 factor (ECF subfamily)
VVGEDRSDAELLRAGKDDPEAFGAFYDRHVQNVLRFFYGRTASAETAAELTAETFAQAFVSRYTFREVGVPASAWILGIAKHQLQRMFRRPRVDAGPAAGSEWNGLRWMTSRSNGSRSWLISPHYA